MDISTLKAANAEAQRLFGIALNERIRTGAWNPVLTDAYLNAEENVRWEVAKARLDDLQAEDHSGDHFAYPVRTVDHSTHDEIVESCYDCQEKVAGTWADVMAPY